MENPGIFLSFLAGIVSILSPCVLPILPSFIAYISGISLSEPYHQTHGKKLRNMLFLDTILFGIGFSIVFLCFGAVIGFIGQSLVQNRPIFEKIAGILIILFGLQLAGILKIKFFLKETKIEIPEKLKKIKHLRSFLMGIFFSFGWAPCYGPIVGTIFTLAAVKTSFTESIILFFFYSLGFLLPLLLIAFGISSASHKLKKIKNFSKYNSIFSGIFIIILGVLLVTGNFNQVVTFINTIYNQNNFHFF